jgi:Isocitrate lyase family
MLASNLSPSFNWDTTGMSDEQMRRFPEELGKLGFVFNFIYLWRSPDRWFGSGRVCDCPEAGRDAGSGAPAAQVQAAGVDVSHAK